MQVTLSISDNTGEFRSGLTPFRKAFNAGDTFNKNSATSSLLPKPPNQVNSLRNMFGWQNNAGSVRQEIDGSFYSGNPKFIYEGSDYTKFKKLQLSIEIIMILLLQINIVHHNKHIDELCKDKYLFILFNINIYKCLIEIVIIQN